MTAISAASATESDRHETTNPFPDLATAGAELRTVLLPASPAPCANRAVLRDLGLRWDPAGHLWHDAATADRVRELRERLHLEARCFGVLEADPPRGPGPPRPPAPTATPVRAVASARDPASRSHDGSRTRAEARTVYGADEEDGVAPWRFSERDITSGLPDDSREEDEREEERRLRDLRGRVGAARAVVAKTPGLAEVLARDWREAARFYARFGVTEETLRNGVSAGNVPGKALANASCHPMNTLAEGGEHPRGVLPSAA